MLGVAAESTVNLKCRNDFAALRPGLRPALFVSRLFLHELNKGAMLNLEREPIGESPLRLSDVLKDIR